MMKAAFTAICFLIASMTTSYADAFGKKVLQNGEVIAFHTSAYMRDNYFYTVKYDN